MTIEYINGGTPTLAPELRVLPSGTLVWPVFHEVMVKSVDEQDDSLINVLIYRGTKQILNRNVNIGVYRPAPNRITSAIGIVIEELNLHLFPESVETLSPLATYKSGNSVRNKVRVAGFIYNPFDLLPRKVK